MNATQQLILELLVVAAVAPLFSSAVVLLTTRRVMFKAAGWFTTAAMAGAFACSVWALLLWSGLPAEQHVTLVWNLPWIPLPGMQAQYLQLGAMVDGLTVAMMVMVTGVAMLVHLYSIGYMAGDKRYNWFFAYLSLFSFSMLGIVMSNSIIELFVFWELVGLTSYLLIGFWFEKRGPRLACTKAFVMNRIGDMGFLVGFGILFYKLGGMLLLPATEGGLDVDHQHIVSMFGALTLPAPEGLGLSITHPPAWLTFAGIGLFCGAIGKSAQFPLHTWLPDAMEGPTPVSSIVHSATMVAAGVYLTARIYPILTPGAHLFVASIGLITLVIAACMALVMTDIKRVLAYSTLSQLGYMVLALGAGAYSWALFHLITHAFFKCCLFQCSGSVIHAAHHEQDMRQYGGLGRKMPVTALCYILCTLAIAGASIPMVEIAGRQIGVSGFYSKDGIIAGTVNYGMVLREAGFGWASNLFWLGPLIVAYITVFYMARSFALTFLGKPRNQPIYDHAHEAPVTMLIPQALLAAMALFAALFPFLDLINQSLPSAVLPSVKWVQPGEEAQMHHGFHVVHSGLLMGFSWIVMLAAGIAIYTPGLAISSRIAAIPGVALLHRWFLNKFYFDALYDVFTVGLTRMVAVIIGAIDKYLVDGLVNLAGLLTKGVAWAAGLFDKKLLDGAYDGAAAFAHHGGSLLGATQAGRIRVYVLLLFASASIITLLVVAVALIQG